MLLLLLLLSSSTRYNLHCEREEIQQGFLSAWRRLNRDSPHFGAGKHGDSEKWWSDLVHHTMRSEKRGGGEISTPRRARKQKERKVSTSVCLLRSSWKPLFS